MTRLLYYIFCLWFLLLPLTVLSSIYLGVAIDKKAAPLLIAFWIMLFLLGYHRIDARKIALLLLVLFFFFIRNISFLSNSSLYLELIWEDAIRFGYFALPVMYLSNEQHAKTGVRLISFNAMAGCFTAFLVAVGMLTLPYERFSASRIGIEEIQKSIGLFSSYGDLAQYAAYILLAGMFMVTNLVAARRGRRIIQLFIVLIVIMGLIGTQSRSYLLSVVTGGLAGILFYYRSKRSINQTLFYLLLVIAGINILAVVGYMFSDIVNALSNLGGATALGTARGRMWQYQFAFSIINEYPILGIDAEYYMKHGYIGHFVHNMWLGQMVRGGILTFLVMLGIMLVLLVKSLRLMTNRHTLPYAVVSTGYIVAVFVSTLFYPADSMLFWALLGMNAAIIYTIKAPVEE